MVWVRKAHIGADSYGHLWPHDGALVEMSFEQATELVHIDSTEFSITETPEPEKPGPAGKPEDDTEINEAPPAPRRRKNTKTHTDEDNTVEE